MKMKNASSNEIHPTEVLIKIRLFNNLAKRLDWIGFDVGQDS